MDATLHNDVTLHGVTERRTLVLQPHLAFLPPHPLTLPFQGLRGEQALRAGQMCVWLTFTSPPDPLSTRGEGEIRGG